MAYNPVVKGFNAIRKIVTKGFAERFGLNAKICRIWVAPFLCTKISQLPFAEMTNSTAPMISQNVSTSAFVCAKKYVLNFVKMKVSCK